MLPSAVLTHLKAGARTALRPEPVRIGWWLQPAAVTPRKHARPSLTTVQPASRLRLAKASISVRRKPRTRRSAQCELGRREDRSGGQRRLPPAGGALIERAGLDQAVPSTAAARADEAVRPPPLGHRRAALLLAAVSTIELGLAQPLLVLNPVPSHRLSPAPASKFSFCTRAGSAEQDA